MPGIVGASGEGNGVMKTAGCQASPQAQVAPGVPEEVAPLGPRQLRHPQARPQENGNGGVGARYENLTHRTGGDAVGHT